MKNLCCVALSAGLLLIGSGSTATATEGHQTTKKDAGVTITNCGTAMPPLYLRACRDFTGKAVAALERYYAFARTGGPTAKSAAKNFELEYRSAARLQIRQRISQWPRTVRHIGSANIVVDLVSVSSADDYATINTHQSWLVTDADGQVVYQLNNKKLKVLMHHITIKPKGAKAHREWVVISIGK